MDGEENLPHGQTLRFRNEGSEQSLRNNSYHDLQENIMQTAYFSQRRCTTPSTPCRSSVATATKQVWKLGSRLTLTSAAARMKAFHKAF